MDIVILRHGQAEGYTTSDAQRSLTDRGVRYSEQAGKCLAKLGLEFDGVWVSPYVRTQQTAEQVLKSYPELAIHSQPQLTPETNPDLVFDLIKQSGLERLLIISHQPLVGGLVALLADASTSYRCPLSPASMVYISNKHMLHRCGELNWLRHAPEFLNQ
ncbi:MAG: phosphohistidine phosphatase [Pseudohongiellaceae bacterium]|jgi:phosphohistidine phosphatase